MSTAAAEHEKKARLRKSNGAETSSVERPGRSTRLQNVAMMTGNHKGDPKLIYLFHILRLFNRFDFNILPNVFSGVIERVRSL